MIDCRSRRSLILTLSLLQALKVPCADQAYWQAGTTRYSVNSTAGTALPKMSTQDVLYCVARLRILPSRSKEVWLARYSSTSPHLTPSPGSAVRTTLDVTSLLQVTRLRHLLATSWIPQTTDISDVVEIGVQSSFSSPCLNFARYRVSAYQIPAVLDGTCCSYERQPHPKDVYVWRAEGREHYDQGRPLKRCKDAVKADLISCGINTTNWEDLAYSIVCWQQQNTQGTIYLNCAEKSEEQKRDCRKQNPGLQGSFPCTACGGT